MISLSDAQRRHPWRRDLGAGKRDVYLQRIGALLHQRAGRYGDADVITAMEIALRSLSATA